MVGDPRAGGAIRAPLPAELLTERVLVILRGDYSPRLAVRAGQVLLDAGLRTIEVTANSPQAAECVAALAGLPGLRVGAGTVLGPGDAGRMIGAGARFLVTPHVDAGLIEATARAGVPILAGALTPSEVWAAWSAGASAVKLFPADAMGPAYLSALRGPFPGIPFVAVGGIDDTAAPAFLRAGAVAVAAGSWLLPARGATLSTSLLADRARRLRAAALAVPGEGNR